MTIQMRSAYLKKKNHKRHRPSDLCLPLSQSQTRSPSYSLPTCCSYSPWFVLSMRQLVRKNS